MKVSAFSAVCEIGKKRLREENRFEKNENESGDDVVEHSKLHEFISRKDLSEILSFSGIGKALESDNCR